MSGNLFSERRKVSLQCALCCNLCLVLPAFWNLCAFVEPLSHRSGRAAQGMSNRRLCAEVLEEVLCSHAFIIGIPIFKVNIEDQIISALR